MTEENQKEQYSRAYIHAIASVAGYKVTPEVVDDDSVDATIASSGDRGATRSPKLDVQLKCSSQNLLKDDGVHFPLPLKNYEDLRRETMVPRILIVVLVPDLILEWTIQDEHKLTMYKAAYWMSLKHEPNVTNKKTVTVRIPRENVLTPDSLTQIMNNINENRQL